MKESRHHIEQQDLLFREAFLDEQSVRRNGGNPNAGLIDFYVNGEIVYSALDTGTPVAGTTITINSEPTSFKGLMSDVRIYDGLLFSEEVSQIWTSEKHRYLL